MFSVQLSRDKIVSTTIHQIFKSSLLAACLAVAACGGGGGGAALPGGNPGPSAIVDSFGQGVNSSDASGVGAGDAGADGTAGEGSPLPGATITITDASGKTASAVADANGYYRAKITGFTAPMVAKAELGTKKIFYSASVDSPKTNGFVTINVTGLTDKVVSDVALAAGRTSSAAITPAIVAANNAALLKAKNDLRTALSAQLTANGLNASTFDPVTLPFRADHTGYDAVLDTTLVSRNGTGTTQITPSGQQYVAGLDTTGISVLVSEFNRLNSTAAGRTSAAFADLVDVAFLDGGENKTVFLSRVTSPSSGIAGGNFINTKVSNCAVGAGLCSFTSEFVRSTGNLIIVDMQIKLTGGVWRLYGDQAPVQNDFKSILNKNVSYNTSTVATTSYSAGYNFYVQNTATYLSAKLEYFVTTNGVAGAPSPLMNVITKAGCIVGFLATDDGAPGNCGNQVAKTDAQLAALNTIFAQGPVTLRITLYTGNNYTGTATTFTKPFRQVMYLASEGPALTLPTVNPAGFATGAVAFTVPSTMTLEAVELVVFKRIGVSPPAQSGFQLWEEGAALALNGIASMAAAEASCGGCGAYTTANFGQITRVGVYARDATERGISTSFSYPFLN